MPGLRSRLLFSAVFMTSCALTFGSSLALAQSQDSSAAPSVAEAAKRAKEQKQAATSAAKVITDDDLDKKNVKPGQEGLTTSAPPQVETQSPSPEAVAAAETADAKAEKSPADDPLKPTDPPKLAQLKEELAKAEEDLKLNQRESSLEQDTFLSNPDHQRDDAGKAKLAELQQLIGDKQQTVETLKAKLVEMEESLKKEAPGARSSEPTTETPAPPPQR